MRDGATAASEDLDIVRAFSPQKIDNRREEFDVPTVVARDANRPHIFLDSRADDVGHRTMIAEINHFNAMPDKLQVDRVDRAIVPVADRDSREDSNWRSHKKVQLNR